MAVGLDCILSQMCSGEAMFLEERHKCYLQEMFSEFESHTVTRTNTHWHEATWMSSSTLFLLKSAIVQLSIMGNNYV